MKKYLIASLLSAVSIGVHAANTEDFAHSYPTVYQNLDWRASTRMLSTIFSLTTVINMGKNLQSEQDKKFIENANQAIPCLKKFDKTATLNLMLKTVQANLSAKDLTIIENYFASPAGNFDVTERKKIILAFFNSDLQEIENVKKEVIMPENKEKLQQAENFVKTHHSLLEKFDKSLTTPEIQKLSKDYIASCKAFG